uniref:Ig-like domain-containing protein n=1 Tax=Sinocyclocheilus rhinocerous TaxID=307959 RepID=A0A673IGA4_9TELE
VFKTPKPKVTIKPDEHVFRGETVTLRCDIYSEGVTSWEYIWNKDGSFYRVSELQELPFSPVTEFDAAKYCCYRAERGGSRSSRCSDEVTLTVSGEAVLSVSPQKWLTEGDSVTLICQVNGSSTGWTFNMFLTFSHIIFIVNCCCSTETPKPKVTIKPDEHVFRGETVTLRCDIYSEGVTSWEYIWNKDGSFYRVSELQELPFSPVTEFDAAKYCCYRAERGGSRSSRCSDEVTLTVSGVSPPVSLIVSPSRTQHFTFVSLSLSCEDQSNSTGWRMRRYTDDGRLKSCSSPQWGSQTGSTCTIRYTIPEDTGVYWCESESGEKHHPVNITVHSGVILESPVHPVTERETLTLRCLYHHSTPPNLRADFYKDGSLIQSQTTEMIIPAVSKSHEGFYSCKHTERGESRKSWISVTVSAGQVLLQIIDYYKLAIYVCLKVTFYAPFYKM